MFQTMLWLESSVILFLVDTRVGEYQFECSNNTGLPVQLEQHPCVNSRAMKVVQDLFPIKSWPRPAYLVLAKSLELIVPNYGPNLRETQHIRLQEKTDELKLRKIMSLERDIRVYGWLVSHKPHLKTFSEMLKLFWKVIFLYVS